MTLSTEDNKNQWSTGQEDYYTTGGLLDYKYFKNYYNMIAIDLCKQQELGADPKTMEQINFTGNLDVMQDKPRCFSLFKKQKKQVQIFHKEL